ncbi:TonB-dependent receptor [Fontimonas sp. SYSU GA230001]|uniref:TonB-dependent receptor n=1 Tax=Fontimonas sp. SYSU GA230001 TaxID=3142450 RepID=UPI0032B4990E
MAAAQDADAELPTIPVREGDPDAPPPAAADDSTVLEDVIVTATKRRAALRDLPQSIAALSGEELEQLGAAELRDFLIRIPGVGQSEIQPDLNRISIRGIQTDVSNVTPAATGLFIDDVPLIDPFLLHVSPDLPPFDLAGIEVLKGPQGTLFGGSALAGALRYKLADAVPGAWESRGFAQYQTLADGSPNRIAGAALNLSLGESDAALRLVGISRLTGGTIDDLRSGDKDTDRTSNFSGRALLRWNAGDDWSVGLKAYDQYTHGEDVPLAETTDGRFERQRALTQSPYETQYRFFALDLTRTLSFGEFVSVTSWLHKQGDLSNAFAERILGVESLGQPIGAPMTEDTRGLVQEFRLVSPDAPEAKWEWLIGAFGHDHSSFTTQRIFTTVPIAGQDADALNFVADVEAREYALFGEASRRLGRRWKATLGLRGYQVETFGTVVSSGVLILASGSPENRNDANVRASGVNPQLALQVDVTDDIASYVSATRGFRFGGVQTIGPSPASPNARQTYSPDTVWNYELGLRTQWLDGALQIDGAVFYIDWNDPQVQTTTGGAVPLNTIDNAGHARSRGGELALRYLPAFLDGLDLGLSWAWADARITEPYVAPGGATVPKGARLPGSADRQLVASLGYRRGFGAAAFTTTLAYVRQGDGVSDILQSMKILDYQTFDLRCGIALSQLWGAPELSVGLMNLTDERAVTTALVQSETNYTTIYNRPRTLDIRLDLRF